MLIKISLNIYIIIIIFINFIMINNYKDYDYDVFVYCGGKCGSSTLNTTFINNGYESIHLHNNEYYKTAYKKEDSIFDVIDNSCKNKKVYIIDSYRTPIEQLISSFFQNIAIHIPSYKNMSLQEIITWFNFNFLNIINYHPQDEVLEHYNIPLFTTFDFQKRYNIIEKDNKVFIKLLFRDIDNWGAILSEIFEKEITMFNNNLTINKDIYNLYVQFKRKYRVPKEFLLKLKYDKNFKIYNIQEEQDIYIQKWLEMSI